MKVLKRNEEQVPEKWVITCDCGKCGSTLVVEEADCVRVVRKTSDQRDVWDEAVPVFSCLVCQGLNCVPSTPRLVVERLKNGGNNDGNLFTAQNVERAPAPVTMGIEVEGPHTEGETGMSGSSCEQRRGY